MGFQLCTLERGKRFRELNIGDYFWTAGQFTIVRQVVIDGYYRKSVVVGRLAQDRVVFTEKSVELTSYGQLQEVGRIVLVEEVAPDVVGV